MRLWSISPRLLDSKGLIALWRETLLAKNVLQGLTKGYKHHPQLIRFRQSQNPLLAINAYLETIANEATIRHYSFDTSKIDPVINPPEKIKVTTGQLSFEYDHLLKKLKKRSPKHYEKLIALSISPTYFKNSIFEVVPGNIEAWEKI
jgi:hypothetical protein